MTTLTSLEDVPISDTWRGPSTVSRLETIKIGKVNTDSKRRLIELEHKDFVIWPWNKYYRYWWGLTVLCGIITVFTEPYAMAFAPAGLFPYDDALSIIEYTLASIFFIDLLTNFFMAYYDENDKLIIDKKEIAIHYLKGLFWLDLAGVLPCYYFALEISGELGNDSVLASYLSILRLIKLVRLYRLKELFDIVQYNPHVSLMMLTLVRNLGFATVWSHFAACIFYFIAKKNKFDSETTWIGESIQELNGVERYVTSLYWSVVTYVTKWVGNQW